MSDSKPGPDPKLMPKPDPNPKKNSDLLVYRDIGIKRRIVPSDIYFIS